MEKIYWTMGEAAAILGESVSLVRFWANTFPKYIKPQRNAKGNRLFSAADIETLKQIHFLVKQRGLTLEGARGELSSQRATVEHRVKVLDSLKAIRSQLVQIKKQL